MMTRLLHNIHSSRRRPLRSALLTCLFLLLLLSPTRSFAQCEPTGLANTWTVGQFVPNDTNMVLNQVTVNLTNFYGLLDLDTLRMQMGQQDQQDWTSIFTGTLNPWWAQWFAAWKAMTVQLSAITVDQTYNLGHIKDATNILKAAQDEQEDRIKAKLNAQPTDQACRFDTNATYLAQDRAIDEAMQNGLEADFVSLANNEFGTIAQNGPAELQNKRWDIYVQNFCDYTAEDCDSGCSPPDGSAKNCPKPSTQVPHPNMDIYVSQMMFHNETLPVADEASLKAMQSMIFNATGFKVPDPILSGAIGSTPGREQVFARREYMAQMSAVGSLLFSVVGDRLQGVEAPYPAAMRKMMGITFATTKPSVREIRQSIIEQLWDPNFYKNLDDNPSTVSEKELYLKAYGLSMLYDIIAKQERISTAYAIETGHILQETLDVHGNFSAEAPNKQ